MFMMISERIIIKNSQNNTFSELPNIEEIKETFKYNSGNLDSQENADDKNRILGWIIYHNTLAGESNNKIRPDTSDDGKNS
ncbi:hypothetical protein PCHCB_000499000 [Plasmodium chabaudi chabaudi]|uniref:Uncharacterized protein n=1 Tax=Plasmodium chabaudi chabaudi TaxID=31271 RepID=A0A1D3L724_PLACU|nr:hypothetical protein PCHCB_000499000 [Plasmodium chabaudi chabaudi]